MNRHVTAPAPTSFAVELVTCDGQRVMVPLYRLAEAHARLSPRRRDLLDVIVDICTQHFELSADAICSDRRDPDIVYARHVAMYLAKHLSGLSTGKIGKRYGGRDHSSIAHAARKIECLIARDPDVRSDVELLQGEIIKVKP